MALLPKSSLLVLVDFGFLGQELTDLTSGMARATQGLFDGKAEIVLQTDHDFLEAGWFAYSALAVSEEIPELTRINCSQMATLFREALGVLATHFPNKGSVRSFEDLGIYDPDRPNRIAEYFGPNSAPLVSVTAVARDALNALRRDPLMLTSLGAPAILRLMRQAVDGIKVTQP